MNRPRVKKEEGKDTLTEGGPRELVLVHLHIHTLLV